MYIKKLDKENKKIFVAIPLTSTSGKTRIKEKSILNEYGIPVPTRTKPLNQKCYVEWQIGYDVKTSDLEKVKLTTLTDKTFVGSNGKKKYLYELSEYIKYFYDWKLISKNDLLEIKNYLLNIEDKYFLDIHDDLLIKRSHLITKNINDLDFMYSKVEYPLLIYKFDKFEIIAEIETKEKQYAVGTQPMLYFCFPITELENSENLIGRTSEKKEEAEFVFDESKKYVLLGMLKIFGILTKNHHADVISIIDLILGGE